MGDDISFFSTADLFCSYPCPAQKNTVIFNYFYLICIYFYYCNIATLIINLY